MCENEMKSEGYIADIIICMHVTQVMWVTYQIVVASSNTVGVQVFTHTPI
jgi:hypothetical protein